MVRLEEVEDEEFIRAAEAKSMEDDDDDYTDTGTAFPRDLHQGLDTF